MNLTVLVLDDEDNSITAGAIVTVLVTLTRESLLDKYGSTSSGKPNDWLAEPEGQFWFVEWYFITRIG